jgi:hypothetical protein
MAQGRSTKIMYVMRWIQTSLSSITNCLSRSLSLSQRFHLHRVLGVGLELLAWLGIDGLCVWDDVGRLRLRVEGLGLRVEG